MLEWKYVNINENININKHLWIIIDFYENISNIIFHITF